MQGIDFPKPETGFAVGFVGTILHSTDLGTNWSPQTSGTFFDLFDVHFASDGMTGLAVGAAGTVLRTTNGGQAGGLELIAAASRKGHFDIDLPLTGDPGIECRSGGSNGYYKVAFTFNNQLSSVDGVASSCGTVRSSTIDDDDAHRLLVSLSGVSCNAHDVILTLTGVHDDQGNTLPSAAVTMSFLLGDVNGDGVVDAADFIRSSSIAGRTPTVPTFGKM